jgi:hypothetical protein
MSTKFVINGIPVEVSDPIEAAALLRALGPAPSPAPHSAASAAAGAGSAAAPAGHSAASASAAVRKQGIASHSFSGVGAISQQMINDSYNFLCALRDNPNGLSSEYVTALFSLADKRAFGSKVARFNVIMQQAGFKPETVYDNPRGQDGRVVWTGRKNLNDAIAAVRLMT